MKKMKPGDFDRALMASFIFLIFSIGSIFFAIAYVLITRGIY